MSTLFVVGFEDCKGSFNELVLAIRSRGSLVYMEADSFHILEILILPAITQRVVLDEMVFSFVLNFWINNFSMNV